MKQNEYCWVGEGILARLYNSYTIPMNPYGRKAQLKKLKKKYIKSNYVQKLL